MVKIEKAKGQSRAAEYMREDPIHLGRGEKLDAADEKVCVEAHCLGCNAEDLLLWHQLTVGQVLVPNLREPVRWSVPGVLAVDVSKR